MGQGQLRITININFVEPEYIMLHAKFHVNRTIVLWEKMFKVFTIYGHGGHLGHVTLTSYINVISPLPRGLHMKFGFD